MDHIDELVASWDGRRRIPCLLLLDTSACMAGAAIDQLNDGLVGFREKLLNVPSLRISADVAIVTFGGTPTLVQDFALPDHLHPPTLSASGDRMLGAAIEQGLEILHMQLNFYDRCEFKSSYPRIYLLLGGTPSDDWHQAGRRVQGTAQKFKFYAAGIGDIDTSIFNTISPTIEYTIIKDTGIEDFLVKMAHEMGYYAASFLIAELAIRRKKGEI